MWVSRRLLTLLGVGAAAAFAALVLPMSAAHAAGDSGVFPGWGSGPYETCNGAVCLAMEPLTQESVKDWTYSGIRPYFTDWKGDQLYDVRYNDDDAGSYTIKIDDAWSPFLSSSSYQFGDFVPNAAAPEGADLGWLGDMSGATIYQQSYFNGAFTNLTMNNVGPHDVNYWVMSTPDMSYTVVSADGSSTAYMQLGDSDPFFLWNSGVHAGLPEYAVPDYVIPNDPFAGLDFDPSDYLGGMLASL